MQLNFSVKDQILTIECPGRLVISDSREHVFAKFSMDAEWDGLAVTAFFDNERVQTGPLSVLLTSDAPVEIPPAALVAGQLYVSLAGIGNGGASRLTTKKMRDPVRVYQSGAFVGLSADAYAPELWEQVMAAMGPLAELKTSDKSSLVAAINEVLSKAGGEIAPDAVAEAVEAYLKDNPIETDLTGAVMYSEELALTAEEQSQARENIGAQIADFVITMKSDEDGNLIPDKTWAEATEAHKAGRRLSCVYNSREYALDSFWEGEEAHFVYNNIPTLTEYRIYFLSNSTAYFAESAPSQSAPPVASVNGLSTTASALLLTILKDCYTGSNQDANILALENELLNNSGGSGGETVTLTSISAIYSGGSVDAGTALTDLTGIVVTANYSDGSTKTVTDYTLSGTIAGGANIITVSYGGKTATFTVIGVEEGEEEITLTSISATYSGGDVAVGTALTELNGITVTGTYSNGSTSEITGYTLSGEIAEGENTITVSYDGKTTTFIVKGVAMVTLASISAVVNQDFASVGTAASELDITVTAHYSDGSTAEVTDYSISGTVAAGENTFTIVYGGKTTTVKVTGAHTPIYALYDTTMDDYTNSGVNPFDADHSISVFIDVSIASTGSDKVIFYIRAGTTVAWAATLRSGGKASATVNCIALAKLFGGQLTAIGDTVKCIITRQAGSTTADVYWYQRTASGNEYWTKRTGFEVGEFIPATENMTMMSAGVTYNSFEVFTNKYVIEAEALEFTGGTVFTEV